METTPLDVQTPTFLFTYPTPLHSPRPSIANENPTPERSSRKVLQDQDFATLHPRDKSLTWDGMASEQASQAMAGPSSAAARVGEASSSRNPGKSQATARPSDRGERAASDSGPSNEEGASNEQSAGNGLSAVNAGVDVPGPNGSSTSSPNASVKLPAMCVPVKQLKWRNDGTLTFRKKVAKEVDKLLEAAKAEETRIAEGLPVQESKLRRFLPGSKPPKEGQYEKEVLKILGKRYDLPKWRNKKPTVERSLWIPEMHLNKGDFHMKNGKLTIDSGSAMEIITRSTLAMDKNDCLLGPWQHMPEQWMSWSKKGEVAALDNNNKSENFDIVKNHLHRGRWVWITRRNNLFGGSVIDIQRTEDLFNARLLGFEAHRSKKAHDPLLQFCKRDTKCKKEARQSKDVHGPLLQFCKRNQKGKKDPIEWPAASESGTELSRETLEGLLQEVLVKGGDERECEGWMVMKTKLENIIRDGMYDRSVQGFQEPCSRCKYTSEEVSRHVRKSSLEDDFDSKQKRPCLQSCPVHIPCTSACNTPPAKQQGSSSTSEPQSVQVPETEVEDLDNSSNSVHDIQGSSQAGDVRQTQIGAAGPSNAPSSAHEAHTSAEEHPQPALREIIPSDTSSPSGPPEVVANCEGSSSHISSDTALATNTMAERPPISRYTTASSFKTVTTTGPVDDATKALKLRVSDASGDSSNKEIKSGHNLGDSSSPSLNGATSDTVPANAIDDAQSIAED